MLELQRKIELVKIALLLIISHVLMGIFQEKIFRTPYIDSMGHSESERFTFAIAYMAAQNFTYVLVAKVTAVIKKHEKNETPQKYFSLPAIFLVFGTILSNTALRWVPFPTQVVGKASKPIAVMLFSVFLARKVYTPQKYSVVFVVVSGVIMFSYKDHYETKDGEDPILGISLIGVSLIADGIGCALQERMRSVSKPTPLNIMLYSSLWNSLYLIVLLLVTGEGVKFLNFCMHFPNVILDLGILVTVGSIGQFCVSSMISNFGSLPLSLVMTVRKCLQVFASVLIFGNELSLRQWMAAAIVFLALIFDAIFQSKPHANESESSQYTDTESESSENKEELLCDEKKVNLMHVVIECDHSAQEKIENLNEDLMVKIQ